MFFLIKLDFIKQVDYTEKLFLLITGEVRTSFISAPNVYMSWLYCVTPKIHPLGAALLLLLNSDNFESNYKKGSKLHWFITGCSKTHGFTKKKQIF